jgi:hypothetical protein
VLTARILWTLAAAPAQDYGAPMKSRARGRMVACPHCGERMRSGVAACPHCGSDERTGWSEQVYLDGIDLPGDQDYADIVEREFGSGAARRDSRRAWWLAAVALFLVALAALGWFSVLR